MDAPPPGSCTLTFPLQSLEAGPACSATVHSGCLHHTYPGTPHPSMDTSMERKPEESKPQGLCLLVELRACRKVWFLGPHVSPRHHAGASHSEHLAFGVPSNTEQGPLLLLQPPLGSSRPRASLLPVAFCPHAARFCPPCSSLVIPRGWPLCVTSPMGGVSWCSMGLMILVHVLCNPFLHPLAPEPPRGAPSHLLFLSLF